MCSALPPPVPCPLPDQIAGLEYLNSAALVPTHMPKTTSRFYLSWRTRSLLRSTPLTRPKHWQEFIPFEMAHTPLKMTIEEAHAEVNRGWAQAYSPEALAHAVESLHDQPLGYRVNMFLARLCFRGIHVPMMGKMAWLKVIAQNRRTIFKLVREGFKAGAWRGAPARIPAIPVPQVEAVVAIAQAAGGDGQAIAFPAD